MTTTPRAKMSGLHPQFFALLALTLLLTPNAAAAHSEIGKDCAPGWTGLFCRANAALARTAYCAVHLLHCAGFGGTGPQQGDEWDNPTPPEPVTPPTPAPPAPSPPVVDPPAPEPPSKLCTFALPDGICDFLANWRTIVFSGIAIGISAPFIFLRDAVANVYGSVAVAINTVYGWVRYAFQYLTGILVDVVTPSPATVQAWTTLNAGLQDLAATTGPLAPLTLSLIYVVLGSIGAYALYYAARGLVLLMTGGRTA